jgi:hypothetical protein
MAIVTVGIDLAKSVFAVHGVDATGKPVLLRADGVNRPAQKRRIPSVPIKPAVRFIRLWRLPGD